MKGDIEFGLILAIIVTVTLLVVGYTIAFVPALEQSDEYKDQIDFRQFCYHWGMEYYRYHETEYIVVQTTKRNYNIIEYCTHALNRGSINANTDSPDIDYCRDLCRGTSHDSN